MNSTSELSELMVDTVTSALFKGQASETSLAYGQLFEEPQTSWAYQIAKRGLDICGALIGLAVLALLLPFIALLVLWEDRGPLFYKQVRVGQFNRPFVTYKFRSMIVNADDYLARHPELLEAWRTSGKLQNDPRITRIGSFLRRTSIDELPQMLNVLWGEMSLVGPRAIQYSELTSFGDLIELRQTAKPGLTGLWQVGGRSMTSYEQRGVLDCIYVMDCSFWMDVCILLKTIPAVVQGIGAY